MSICVITNKSFQFQKWKDPNDFTTWHLKYKTLFTNQKRWWCTYTHVYSLWSEATYSMVNTHFHQYEYEVASLTRDLQIEITHTAHTSNRGSLLPAGDALADTALSGDLHWEGTACGHTPKQSTHIGASVSAASTQSVLMSLHVCSVPSWSILKPHFIETVWTIFYILHLVI